MEALPIWLIILLCVGVEAVIGTVIYLIIHCMTQNFEIDFEDDEAKAETGVTEE